MRRFGTLPLVHQPGERWMYNTGADVLGVLVARAAGQPFATFLRERIFEPLGMHDTGFSVPPEKIDRFVDRVLDATSRPARSRCTTKRSAASGVGRPRSRRVRAGWCRPPTTSTRSAR